MLQFILRESAEANAAMEAMANSFETQGDPYIGPFWYDPAKKELYGYVLTLASDRPFYHSTQQNKNIRTGHALHQSIWQKERRRGKDPRFQGDYTARPRGRVFEFENEGFVVFVGNWIEEYPEAKEAIIDTFQLPRDHVRFQIDSHWDLGHGWSDEV